MSRRIHIFNPECDLALGINRDTYTPTSRVARFAALYALLPALYADSGDIICLRNREISPENLPYFPLIGMKGLRLTFIDDLAALHKEDFEIFPWGWNRALIYSLRHAGAAHLGILSEERIATLRGLAHRKLSTQFHLEYGSAIPGILPPRIFTDISEAVNYTIATGVCCAKLPWSSSGRGIVFSDLMTQEQWLNWISGAIRKQSSVIIEKKYIRLLDFASEWFIDRQRDVHFEGYSLFKVSNRGKYEANILGDSREITERILSAAPLAREYMELQREFIRSRIAPHYRGPLGFDMFVTGSGAVNPCVEINLRHTMGHVALSVAKQMNDGASSVISTYLKSCFPNNLLAIK